MCEYKVIQIKITKHDSAKELLKFKSDINNWSGEKYLLNLLKYDVEMKIFDIFDEYLDHTHQRLETVLQNLFMLPPKHSISI